MLGMPTRYTNALALIVASILPSAATAQRHEAIGPALHELRPSQLVLLEKSPFPHGPAPGRAWLIYVSAALPPPLDEVGPVAYLEYLPCTNVGGLWGVRDSAWLCPEPKGERGTFWIADGGFRPGTPASMPEFARERGAALTVRRPSAGAPWRALDVSDVNARVRGFYFDLYVSSQEPARRP